MRPARMHSRSFVLAAACLATMAPVGSAWSDEVSMPGKTPAEATNAPAAVPARGVNMNKVEAQFGAPTQRSAAIGKPPITRWDYPGFSVYFEYQHVIHSVIR
ncbi:MAG: hypothetical protein AB7T07_09960 [Steroidobacteraceae bacterium]